MERIGVEEYYNEEHREIMEEQEMIRRAEIENWCIANGFDVEY